MFRPNLFFRPGGDVGNLTLSPFNCWAAAPGVARYRFDGLMQERTRVFLAALRLHGEPPPTKESDWLEVKSRWRASSIRCWDRKLRQTTSKMSLIVSDRPLQQERLDHRRNDPSGSSQNVRFKVEDLIR